MTEETQTNDVIPEPGSAGPQGAAAGEVPLEKLVHDQKWERKFRLLSEFKERHGYCNVSPHDKAHRGLLAWGAVQRTARKDGVLDAEHARRLDELGFDWTIVEAPDPAETRRKQSEELWRRRFEELLAFKERFGHYHVPAKWAENKQLGHWVHVQREFRRKGWLNEERIKRLDEIGFAWHGAGRFEYSTAENWNRRYAQLTDFHGRFGHCEVPSTWAESPPLAKWVGVQRALQSTGKLAEERRRKLDSLGFTWRAPRRSNDQRREQRIQELLAFKERFGHCHVPAKWNENKPLGHWVHVQREFRRNGWLSAERIKRLDEIGFAWHGDGRFEYSTAENWNRRYAQLTEFKERFGHCEVPAKWAENTPLAKWVGVQRALQSTGKLEEKRKQVLDALGFTWREPRRSLDSKWEVRFGELLAFKGRFGHGNVPARWKENIPLGHWVAVQRDFRRKGMLSEERIRRLDEIGFVWNLADPAARKPAVQWQQRFEQIQDYKKRFGHFNVPSKWPEAPQLRGWVDYQRRAYRRGILSPENRQRLEAIEFAWTPPHRPPATTADHSATPLAEHWMARFNELEEFKSRFGHCNVPKHWPENLKLGQWAHQQRTVFKRGRMLAGRKERLDALGFNWYPMALSAPHTSGVGAPPTMKARDELWDRHFKRLEEFKANFGHCNVPGKWKEDLMLSRWVDRQRLKQSRGQLGEQRENRLKELGLRWYGHRERHVHESPDGIVRGSYPPTSKWEQRFAELLEFHRQFGHCNIPDRHRENRTLGIWAGNQRIADRQGRLHPEKRRRLDELGFRWSKPAGAPSPGWEHHFAQLVEFKKQFGHCNVPHKFPENPSLASWLSNQRHNWRTGRLRPERVRRFEEIGMTPSAGRFQVPRAGSWERRFAELAEFKNRFGHTEVPSRWPDFRLLCAWVHTQRRAFTAGTLAEDRKRRLDELGLDWTPDRRARDAERPPRVGPCLWEWRFEELRAYRQRFGHCNVPKDWRKNPQLGAWTSKQRASYLRGGMEPERARRLEELGFDWHCRAHKWEKRFAELQDFHRRFGHCNVPHKWEENSQLATWAYKQRAKHLAGRLSEDRRMRLSELGFEWARGNYFVTLNEGSWEQRFRELQDFHRRFGHCNVPKAWPTNRQLGTWVHKQRARYLRGRLQPDRTCRLEELGFEWQRGTLKWEERFEELQEFHRRFGHCKVPASWQEAPKLHRWASKQRTRYSRGRLERSRVRRLEKLGFEWAVLDRQWEQRFEELREFHRQSGHCNVPKEWPPSPQLGGWVSKQRARYRHGAMEPERIRRLEAIGFEWQRVRTGLSE